MKGSDDLRSAASYGDMARKPNIVNLRDTSTGIGESAMHCVGVW